MVSPKYAENWTIGRRKKYSMKKNDKLSFLNGYTFLKGLKKKHSSEEIKWYIYDKMVVLKTQISVR